jgi:Ca-activated chloride channel family protein
VTARLAAIPLTIALALSVPPGRAATVMAVSDAIAGTARAAGIADFARMAGIVSRAGGSRTAPQATPFRGGIDLVHLGVTVTDRKANLVAELSPDDFEVYEDGKPQTIRYFAAGDAPGDAAEMHLGLVIDVSESMGEDMRFTKTAAIKFLNMLVSAVDITVVDFDSEVRAARYSQAEFARVIERIRQQKAGGWTALYDAVALYLDGAAGQRGRKIMLLYTDGGDTRSAMSFSDLIEVLKACDVTVYAIGELEHQSSSGRNEARRILSQMAETTGGQSFFPTSVKELDAIYEKVLAEIRAQYTIGYLSTNEQTDGAWRKVEIKIAGRNAQARDLRVRARRGYWGPYRKP